MLYARSPEECHLYIELHPCSCGEAEFEWARHRREERGDQLVSVYEGSCGRCGAARAFEFEVSHHPPPPPAYGGEEPSRIIDPYEFLVVAQQLAGSVPPEPDGLSPAELDEAQEALEMAVAAITEVLKFIPAGADTVPADEFRSSPGRETRSRAPEWFSRAQLAATLAAYQDQLHRYAAAGAR